jgi:hypothetical protein
VPIIFFYFLKIILRSAHQNDLKTSKIYYFKAKKKKIQIFSEALLKSTPKQAISLCIPSKKIKKCRSLVKAEALCFNISNN